MIQTVIFLIFTVLFVAAFVWILLLSAYCIISRIRKKASPKQHFRLKRTAIFSAAVMVLNLGLVTLSQLTASTPRIVDENGNTPEGSIAELKRLELNGRKQWISLRGRDKNAPVLLFLAGGPGGTQMAAVRHELAEMEKHFVIVNWDQPGSGKSYYAEKTKNITVETYIQDGFALTEYLKERFSQKKIYLMGESWGSALGIFLIHISRVLSRIYWHGANGGLCRNRADGLREGFGNCTIQRRYRFNKTAYGKRHSALLRKGRNMEKRGIPELSQCLHGKQSRNSQSRLQYPSGHRFPRIWNA